MIILNGFILDKIMLGLGLRLRLDGIVINWIRLDYVKDQDYDSDCYHIRLEQIGLDELPLYNIRCDYIPFYNIGSQYYYSMI